MARSSGAPRKLSDLQIQRVLQWNAQGKTFRKSHGTIREIAQRLGVSPHTVHVYLSRGELLHSTKSSSGRPRRLGEEQIAWLIAWRVAGLRYRIEHGTIARLAQELGVSQRTIQNCVRCNGQYKQFHREQLPVTSVAITELANAPLHASTSPDGSERDRSERNALLRAWQISTGSRK